MAAEKITFEQFFQHVEDKNQGFIQELHDYLVEIGCKESFEEKKSGMLASYKHKKLKRVIINMIFRKHGMLIRVYGENAFKYQDFLDIMPDNMIESVDKSGDCTWLTQKKCSPKCGGYDFHIKGQHFQKCKYNCFEFLIIDENKAFIRDFIDNELRERTMLI